MSEAPEEPAMVTPPVVLERYCSVNRSHETRRLLSDVYTAHTALAHCKSPTCSWCVECYGVRTGRRPGL